jgi:sugar O-acyltransferase (sialic acid O-acetyltransferase NeuD family)
MDRIIFVGAGGFGRELFGWVQSVQAAGRDWQIKGFLDSNPNALDNFGVPYPVIGDPNTYAPQPDDLFVCAIARPEVKLRICRGLQQRGARFLTLVHPTVVMDASKGVGAGCIFQAYSSVSVNVQIGDFVLVNAYTGIGHDAQIGDACTLSAHCDVTGGAILGEGVFLGSHATILPGMSVGDYATVGAGSVVLRRVRPRTTVMGVPARQIAGFKSES